MKYNFKISWNRNSQPSPSPTGFDFFATIGSGAFGKVVCVKNILFRKLIEYSLTTEFPLHNVIIFLLGGRKSKIHMEILCYENPRKGIYSSHEAITTYVQ